MNFKRTFKNIMYFLIVINCGLLIVSLFYPLNPPYENIVYIVDLITSLSILSVFLFSLYKSENKIKYLKLNFLILFASIPIVLLFLIPNYNITLIKLWILIKLIVLLRREIKLFLEFIKENHLDKILILTITIIFFAVFVFSSISPLHLSLVDSFWFVITSVTTVGYGDIIPLTYETKILTMLLVVLGFLTLSVLAGSISAAYSNNVTVKEEIAIKKEFDELKGEISNLNKDINDLNKKLDNLTKIIEDLKK